MKMTLRWYGKKSDSVTLEQIRQIPGVTGVITTLYDIPAGQVWLRERIHAMKEEVEAAGLSVEGIESVNVHDAIKAATPERDQYINNYIETLENLGEETFIWSATILCLFLTGQERNLQESVQMVLRYLLIPRRLWMPFIQKRCLLPLARMPMDSLCQAGNRNGWKR